MTNTGTRAKVVTSSTQSTLDKLATFRRAEAESAHAQYPQYAGHWNGWRIAEITRTVRTKLGVAFEVGDLVLVSPEVREDKVAPRGRNEFADYADWPIKQFATAYSYRNGCDTAISVTDVREVVITD
jgi:hypothetical protein